MSTKRKDDNKLLAAIAGVVVAGAAGVALLAGLTADREADNAVAKTRSPQQVERFSAEPATFRPQAVPSPITEPAVPLQTTPEPRFEVLPGQDFVAEGLAAYETRDFERAAAYFKAQADERPDDAWTHYILGLSLWKDARPDVAVDAMRRAADLDSESIRTWINLSRIENDRAEYGSALEAAERGLAIDGDDATAMFLKGRSLNNLRRTDEALVALQRSIELSADNGFVHNLVGLIRLSKDDTDGAIEALETAAQLQPNVAFIQNNLGMALEHVGERAAAVEAYRRAVELNPDHAKAVANLARLESRPGEAEVEVEIAQAAD
jgi:tetratricopeptide (TPR) repeat protein